MHIIKVPTRLKNAPKTYAKKKPCQTCNRRGDRIRRHPTGLYICVPCKTQIDVMLNEHGIQPEEIRHLSGDEKQRWIQAIDEMHLYQPEKHER
jgi:hypothetical protein